MPWLIGKISRHDRAPGAENANTRSHVRERSIAGLAPWLGLVFLSIGFRVPALINAANLHSDAAIVGLQAMHILRGEWSPLLFGSAYQTSVDSAVAALFFVPAGPGPLALMLSTLAGHLVLTLLVHATLRRALAPPMAFVLSLVLVFTPPSVHTFVLNPPRQMSLTLAIAGFCALDGAARKKKLWLAALGGVLVSLACFADPYALVFTPGAAVLVAMCALDGGPGRKQIALGVLSPLAGAAVGSIALVWLWNYPGAKHGTTDIATHVLVHNWRLFWDTCLPWGLSYQAWREEAGHWAPWSAPLCVRVVQISGAFLFVSAIAFGALSLRMRGIASEARRLGLAGAVTCAATVAGFLTSVMVMDHFSTRYLAAIVLAAPFALAPFAARVSTRFGLAALLPYLGSAALCGWLGFAQSVDGLRVMRTPDGSGRDERALERELLARGVKYAMADYWVSYRLTFLYQERVIVVPKNLVEDRYAPYKTGFERASVLAYVFDPERSREAYASIPEQLKERGVVFESGEWIRAGALSALVVRRTP